MIFYYKVIMFFLYGPIVINYDLKHYKIKNNILLGLFMTIFCADIGFDDSLIVKYLFRAGISFIFLTFVALLVKGIGSGDVKLIVLAAYIFGLWNTLIMLITSCLLGIVYGIIKGKTSSQNDNRIAFSPFIYLGIVVSLLMNPRVQYLKF